MYVFFLQSLNILWESWVKVWQHRSFPLEEQNTTATSRYNDNLTVTQGCMCRFFSLHVFYHSLRQLNGEKKYIYFWILFPSISLVSGSFWTFLAAHCRFCSLGRSLQKSDHKRAHKLLVMSSRSEIPEIFVKSCFLIWTELNIDIEYHNQTAF